VGYDAAISQMMIRSHKYSNRIRTDHDVQVDVYLKALAADLLKFLWTRGSMPTGFLRLKALL
jgi:hypothetical protein